MSTVGLTSAGVEVLIFKLCPIFSAFGNSRKNQDLGPTLHGLSIGIYLFYENWSTETFRKKESKRQGAHRRLQVNFPGVRFPVLQSALPVTSNPDFHYVPEGEDVWSEKLVGLLVVGFVLSF
jgi:hypothetical protein